MNQLLRYISHILIQLMSGSQSEKATVEIVEEKSGPFRMLPALPSSGMEETQLTTSSDNNMY